MGSGKTSWVRERVSGAQRLLVWDGKGIDWGTRERCTVVTAFAGLNTRLLKLGAQRTSVRVSVNRENFATFCKLAWVWARYQPGVLVVDEIADVTSPAKASQEWGEIARKARAFGSDVYVTTQRPQECDKTAQGNAMLFHCGLMADADDQAYVARRCLGGVPVAQVAHLAPLEWIERDVRTRLITTGRLSFRKRR